MKPYSDDYPLNALINIDYQKDIVTFDYGNPEQRKDYFKQLRFIFGTVIILWLMLFLIIGILLILGNLIQHPEILIELWKAIQAPKEPLPPIDFLLLFKEWARTILLLAVPVMISQYILANYKYFSKIYPKINFWLFSHFQVNKIKHVHVNQLTTNQYVVPIFSNVMLEYEATEEYSTYLTSVKVDKIDYHYLINNKKKEDDYHFKAIFEFSQVPSKGFLHIAYM